MIGLVFTRDLVIITVSIISYFNSTLKYNPCDGNLTSLSTITVS